MHYELTVNVGRYEKKAFMQDGFYTDIAPTSHLHAHTYTEVHLLTGGAAIFNVDGNCVGAESDTMLLFPPKVFHCCSYIAPETLHSAFQIDCLLDKFTVIDIPKGVIPAFFDEIKKSTLSNDHTTVCAYMSLLCSYFFKDEKSTAHRINDPKFLICEFFSNQYSLDVNLGDLAKVLCLSERQAERLVVNLTGKTFQEELTSKRIAMAKRLKKTTAMSLKEISEYVGYRSYSGFWKAMKKEEARGKR